MKRQLKHFANDGFGWYCVRCAAAGKTYAKTSRLMTEGEAESREPQLSETAMAKWTDPEKTILKCERCDAQENVRD